MVWFSASGKIGLPVADNLIKSGYRVVGYRRGSLAEFEKIGGVPARSAADVGAQADVVLTCLPSTEALDEVVHGARGLIHSARPGEIRGRQPRSASATLGQDPRDRAFARQGAAFVDGEVSGTPGMVAARKAVVYLAGDAEACKKLEAVVAGITDSRLYFGEFGAASRVKLVNILSPSILP